MKRFALVFAFLVGLAAPVWADFEDGKAAYQRGDYTTALREWRPLAEQGGAQAQLGLGVIYYNGKGVPKDNAEAKKWFRKAAEQDFAAAQYRLGQVYYNERDFAEAANWFRKAVTPRAARSHWAITALSWKTRLCAPRPAIRSRSAIMC